MDYNFKRGTIEHIAANCTLTFNGTDGQDTIIYSDMGDPRLVKAFKKEIIRRTPRTVKREFFGEFSRYALITFRDRFGGITYMVQDAEHINPETGLPLIIRQADTKEAALDGII